jgi:retinol dehydrogenase 14
MARRMVLITGATSCIGKATAVGLAAMGAHLAFTCRDTERTQAASDEIRTAGGGAGSICSSPALSAQAEVRRLADEMSQRLPCTSPR